MAALAAALDQSRASTVTAAPMIEGIDSLRHASPTQVVRNPADHHEVVGHVQQADAKQVDLALSNAERSFDSWAGSPAGHRSAILERGAELLQEHMLSLVSLLIREAGKTGANAVSEEIGRAHV